MIPSGYPPASPTPPADPAAGRAPVLALVAAVASVIAFACSFVQYYSNVHVTVSFMGISQGVSVPGGVSAWHGGYAWVGALLVLLGGLTLLTASAVIPAARRTAVSLGATAGLAIGCVLVALSGFIDPSFSDYLEQSAANQGINWSQLTQTMGMSITFGRGAGFWLTLVFGIIAFIVAVCVFPALRHQATPTPMPTAGFGTYPAPPGSFQPPVNPYQPGPPYQQPPTT